MSFGDAVAVAVMCSVCWMFGAVFGSILKDIFGRFTMLVLTCMHISVFVTLVCIVGECNVVEMLEELMSMDFLDGVCFIGIPTLAILGSRFGQEFRIRIERR